METIEVPTGGDCSEEGVNIIKHCLCRYERLGTQVFPNVQLSLLPGWGQGAPLLIVAAPSLSPCYFLCQILLRHKLTIGEGSSAWIQSGRGVHTDSHLVFKARTILLHTRALSFVLSSLLLILLFLWKSQGMAIQGEESCVHEWFLKRSPLLKVYLEVFMDSVFVQVEESPSGENLPCCPETFSGPSPHPRKNWRELPACWTSWVAWTGITVLLFYLGARWKTGERTAAKALRRELWETCLCPRIEGLMIMNARPHKELTLSTVPQTSLAGLVLLPKGRTWGLGAILVTHLLSQFWKAWV